MQITLHEMEFVKEENEDGDSVVAKACMKIKITQETMSF